LKITIVNPVRANLSEYNDLELIILKKQLTYINKSILFNIKKLKENQWLRSHKPYIFESRLNELNKKLRNCVVFQDIENGINWIRPGSIPYITGIEYTVENLIKYPKANPYIWRRPLEVVPYDYQTNAVSRLINGKHDSVEMATGTGKSLVLLMITQQLGLKTIIVTPSQSIFLELYKLFSYHLGDGKVGMYGDGKKDIKKPITIAIAKSLTTVKPDSKEYKFFQDKQVLCCDESHLIPSETLEKACHSVLNNIPYRFFVSATQTRSSDGAVELLQSIIGRTVLKLPIKEAIEQGYLCPLKFKIIKTNSLTPQLKKDPIENKRKHFLRNSNIAKLAAKIANINFTNNGQSTLILVEELQQIQMLIPLLKAPFSYIHATSNKEAAEYDLQSVDLETELEKFNKGDVKVLIGTKAISTGTNIYPQTITINWVGGSSEIVTKQGSIGRSTRLLEKSKYKEFHKPKKFVTIVDFNVDNNESCKYQLEKRIEFYKEVTEDIQVVNIIA
jgi:superfamily II DNA or RNA helicase